MSTAYARLIFVSLKSEIVQAASFTDLCRIMKEILASQVEP